MLLHHQSFLSGVPSSKRTTRLGVLALNATLNAAMVLLGCLLFGPRVVSAADRPWTGGTNTTWSTAGNWTGGVPGNNDNAVFNGTFTNHPNLTGNASVGGIWMTGSVVQSVTVSGSSVLTLSGNTINGTASLGILMDNANAFTLTISTPLKIGNAQTWTNNSGNLLTIGAGGVDLNNRAFTINGSGNTTISGIESGAGAFTKAGTGTLTLSGANTFTGQFTVQAGTLAIGTINNASAAGVLGNSANAVILGSTGGVTGTLRHTGVTASSTKRFTMATGGVGKFDVDSSGTNLTLSGVIDGSGDMVKVGAGTLTLSGTNTFTGQLSVQAGTLAIGTINNASANGVLGNSANSVVLGNTGGVTGTLQYTGATASSTKKFTMATGGTGVFQVTTAGTTLTLSGIIDGSGDLTKTGAGTLTLSGVNTYSGMTTISNGTLKLGNASSIPSGSGKGDVVINGGASTAGTLDLAGLNVSINGLSGTTGAVLGTVINSTAATSRTLTLGNNNATSTFAGTIKDNNGSGGTMSLAKVGSGTQTLTGTNTYTGTTTVTGGTLQVGSSGTGSTGTGVTTVGDGTNAATLAGTGTVGGTASVTNHVVKAAAFLKPGDSGGASNGTLTFSGNLNLNTNSVTQLQLTTETTSTDATFGGNTVGSAGYLSFVSANLATWNSAGVGNHDSVFIQGTLTLGTNSSGLFQVVDNGYTSTAAKGDVFDLLDWTLISAGSFNAGTNYRTGGLGSGDLLLPDLSPLGLAWDVQNFTTHGILVVVPEPSRAVLLMIGLAWGLCARRRRIEVPEHPTTTRGRSPA